MNFSIQIERGWNQPTQILSEMLKRRSEQAPGSVFHPRDESEKIDSDFLGPFWCHIKVDPER